MNPTDQAGALVVQPRQQFDLSPQTFEQALTFSNYLADSDMVPKDFKGKPGNCLIAMQWGAELGLKPLQALQNLAIINGRPSLWGDAVIALVRGSQVCEYVIEEDDGHKATCRVKRRNESEQVRTFSMDDAKAAGLAGKQGPWTQYPKRMRQMRARAFALRDVFPDVLRGMPVAEELQDMARESAAPVPSERHMGAAEVVTPAWPADRWAAGLSKWVGGITAGKPLAEVLAWLNSKAKVTPEQEQQLRDEVAKRNQETGAPSVDAEKLAADFAACKDLDRLYELAGLIDAVADEATALRLKELFTVKQEALEQE